ncbi:MAG: carboxypeptidase regulatory-like domain-containing protein [Planctomycetota bacterium]|nr:MAG: carboxypeptidase regulatory-like domain-containing protein [Planctomycetota bacterium]REJ88375.1 MAG: carboxypeptidase regulatory-like domain-containing protein [Planctomycetota bacterium]REK30663.1 MAG: carboxypeptidase regulatory-like domain-containing protein [Planctomycetota bacterium]REK33037.1 MAG: carboxypeptidase regulatory-like domain-containing protein [Planctomycetota bacterium]
MRRQTAAVLLFGLTTLFAAGCGGGGEEAPELAPVTGVVTINGQPVEGLMLRFQPEAGRESQGKTDAEGRYELVHVSGEDGAELGRHVVRFEYDDPAEAPQEIPAEYNVESQESATVQEGENTFDFNLEIAQ